MKNTKPNRNTDMNRYIKQTLLSVFVGECVAIICILFFSVVISNMDIPSYMANVFMIFSAAIAALVGGYINGRMTKQKGIFAGLAVGVILAVIFVLIKLVFFYPMDIGIFLLKLAMTIIAGALGGIFGANKKIKQKIKKH